jgi:D-serine deaminase-like pyridoxal phosphate-dependent protein
MSSAETGANWYELADSDALPSPALLVYPQRVKENVRRMLAIAGGPQHLRPHIKTHKMPELVKLQLGLGVNKFKCATVSEAEMAAEAGVRDLLLAYQPVGPAIQRVVALMRRFPEVRFSVIVDDAKIVHELSAATQRQPSQGARPGLEVLVDVDIGQHRTGVPPGDKVIELYRLITSLPGIEPGGIHAYDGHLAESDPAIRAKACELAFAPVAAQRDQLERAGLSVPRLVTSGTPTFPIHARRGNVECSPGTCVFWDAGYAHKLRDLDFLPAALVLTRVVSKPGGNRLCLDLGHKAVASEMPHPRVVFLNLPEAESVAHSEEHLVIETPRSSEFEIGDCLYGLPWHICPTVALHSEATVVENGQAVGTWEVTARQRKLTI